MSSMQSAPRPRTATTSRLIKSSSGPFVWSKVTLKPDLSVDRLTEHGRECYPILFLDPSFKGIALEDEDLKAIW